MTCIVTYDISDHRTRARLAKYLLGMGVRLQYSVYAIQVERHAFKRMISTLERLADKKGKVAVFRLCAGCQKNALQMNEGTPLFYVF